MCVSRAPTPATRTSFATHMSARNHIPAHTAGVPGGSGARSMSVRLSAGNSRTASPRTAELQSTAVRLFPDVCVLCVDCGLPCTGASPHGSSPQLARGCGLLILLNASAVIAMHGAEAVPTVTHLAPSIHHPLPTLTVHRASSIIHLLRPSSMTSSRGCQCPSISVDLRHGCLVGCAIPNTARVQGGDDH